jgi:hypothetical protein
MPLLKELWEDIQYKRCYDSRDLLFMIDVLRKKIIRLSFKEDSQRLLLDRDLYFPEMPFIENRSPSPEDGWELGNLWFNKEKGSLYIAVDRKEWSLETADDQDNYHVKWQCISKRCR